MPEGSNDLTNKEVLEKIMARFDAFEALKLEHDLLKIKVEEIERNQKKLSSEVSFLASELAQIQQIPLQSKAVMRGVPESEYIDSNLLNAVQLLIKKSKDGNQNFVTAVARIGLPREGEKGRPIQLTFTDQNKMLEVIADFRKNPSTLAQIGDANRKPLGTTENRVYLNEQLGKINAKVYFAARILKKTGVVRFAWVKGGKVFVREAENSSMKRITHTSQLADFAGGKKLSAAPVEDKQVVAKKKEKPVIAKVPETRSTRHNSR